MGSLNMVSVNVLICCKNDFLAASFAEDQLDSFECTKTVGD